MNFSFFTVSSILPLVAHFLFLSLSFFLIVFIVFSVSLFAESRNSAAPAVSFSSISRGFRLAFAFDEPIQLTRIQSNNRNSRVSLISTTLISWLKLFCPVDSLVEWNFSVPPFIRTHTKIKIPTIPSSVSSHYFPASISIRSPAVSPRRPTLILDLDETLVHTFTDPQSTSEAAAAASIPVRLETRKGDKNFFILKRPGLDKFLHSLAPHYSLVVFTASVRRYADAVVDRIDPNKLIEKRFFRSSCIRQNGQFIKDLATVTRDLSRTLIVDNSPLAYSLHEENAIPIETWIDSESDEELIDLIPFLLAIKNQEDIRTLLRRRKNNQLFNSKEIQSQNHIANNFI